jgi:hypothetical protein
MTKKYRQCGAGTRVDASDRAHAPGKQHLGRVRTLAGFARNEPAKRPHDQPWVPTSGLVGRSRRSARRG